MKNICLITIYCVITLLISGCTTSKSIKPSYNEKKDPLEIDTLDFIDNRQKRFTW
ncbi:hypothetical protein [Sulfurospirillum arcachonense]|uniref:hypothetical protein n=1 Tax=Sulfurospirillum arcachonense TaxID=57666 RepID=UPI0012EB28FE|nr:hypothetical protein [Sulfurospirillum arcachonense]